MAARTRVLISISCDSGFAAPSGVDELPRVRQLSPTTPSISSSTASSTTTRRSRSGRRTSRWTLPDARGEARTISRSAAKSRLRSGRRPVTASEASMAVSISMGASVGHRARAGKPSVDRPPLGVSGCARRPCRGRRRTRHDAAMDGDVRWRPYRNGDEDWWQVRRLLVDSHAAAPPSWNWGIRRWDGARFHNEVPRLPDGFASRTALWETADGRLVGVVHPEGETGNEAFLELDPDHRRPPARDARLGRGARRGHARRRADAGHGHVGLRPAAPAAARRARVLDARERHLAAPAPVRRVVTGGGAARGRVSPAARRCPTPTTRPAWPTSSTPPSTARSTRPRSTRRSWPGRPRFATTSISSPRRTTGPLPRTSA